MGGQNAEEMAFVTFTSAEDGRQLVVNATQILFVGSDGETTTLFMCGGSRIAIQGALPDVALKLNDVRIS